MAHASGRYGTALYGDSLYGVNYGEIGLPGVRWDLIALSPQGEALSDLIGATSKKFTFRLNEPSSVEWAMAGDDPGAAVVDELTTDVEAWRNGVRLFRGRVGPSGDEVGPTDHRVAFSAADYRAMLDRRIIWADATYTGIDQSAIAWDLIADAQLIGGMGITNASTATGVTRDRTYEAGKNLGEAIQQLSEVIGGFDWDISPEMGFRTWYPRRGIEADFVAVWGDTVSQVSRQLDPSGYANAIRFSGADGVTPTTRQVADLYEPSGEVNPIYPGRFDAQEGDTDITTTAALGEKADAALAERGVIRPSYKVTLMPGVWDGPATFWLGDICRLIVRRGRLDVDTEARVHEITVTDDGNGGETVEVTFDRAPASVLKRITRDAARLDRLERR
jgi:hypothetical protein